MKYRPTGTDDDDDDDYINDVGAGGNQRRNQGA
jgi:hypothetical protein